MNGNNIVLDTNIILYLLSGDNTISTYIQDKYIYLSIITEMELIGYPDISDIELQEIKNFLKDCTIMEVSEGIKTIYSDLRKKYRLKLGDAAAAATAIYLDVPFISADKGFNKVNELQLTLYNP